MDLHQNATIGMKDDACNADTRLNGFSSDSHDVDDKMSSEKVDGDKEDDFGLLYSLNDKPPWYLCLFLGFQHYLTAFGSTLTVPLVLAGPLCFGQDLVGLSELIATYFFVAGISTLIQSTIGIRLPILQGATFSFLAPTAAILSLPEWQCPQNATATDLVFLSNGTTDGNVAEAADGREVWQSRLREIQGAICVASLFEVAIGASGILSVVLRYVGPLTIAPTITLIGLSLFQVAADKASSHWWIAIAIITTILFLLSLLRTIVLIALFSQYLRGVTIPIPSCGGRNKSLTSLPIFKLFPILLAVLVSWLLCGILTVAGALPDDPKVWGYMARTDIKADVVKDSKWFRFPYPGQWGIPTVSAGAVFGMLAGVLASMVESIGDYYACARLSGAPPPTSSAINRGIAVEGVGCIIAGLIGTGNGTTSYSENVGAIGITRVGSLRVIQSAALLLIVFGCIGKVGAVFVTIPDPVVGGLFLCMFGMITAVGLSDLQYVNMGSSRNLFVVASSFFLGLAIPHWVASHDDAISTGERNVDQILRILLSTSMFVGGAIGFLLDTTLPGTPEERGLIGWMTSSKVKATSKKPSRSTYDVPVISKWVRSKSWGRFIPICPSSDVNLGDETKTKRDMA